VSDFGELQRVDAGVLNVGYAEAGPADGPAVLLLHGWPYDIHSFVEVAPLLAAAGYRVIMPYLRGYGTTGFLSGETLRNGQQSVLARDAIALMDALEIDKAIVAGFDWGARTANIVAALWPERCKLLQNGTSTTPRSIAARPRSTTRTMSVSSSTITVGGWAWPTVSRNTTIWNSGSPRVRSSPCPPSPLKVTPTAHHTPTPTPTPTSSWATIRIG
jgi:pimeloyl-ACP methyl ester carboxylesterase